ncbi:MAG: hypothetical protein D6732_09450 [Methanobacteriota archaeon]|nr:MAG: hypothetical protein D6732_09450 [Euryarchaeota archaeon]
MSQFTLIFLDDDKIRFLQIHDYLKSLGNHDVSWVKWAKNTSECLQVMSGDYVLSLDHDLGREGQNYDIVAFCNYIEQYSEDIPLPKLVIVHSMNPVGAIRIMRALQDTVPVYRVPFGSDLFWECLANVH